MALTALDLLGRVIASRAAGLHGLDALTVDHRRRGTGLAPDPLAVEPDELVVDGLEQARAAKAQAPAIDCRTRGNILGPHAQGTHTPQHIKAGVNDTPNRPFPGPCLFGRLTNGGW